MSHICWNVFFLWRRSTSPPQRTLVYKRYFWCGVCFWKTTESEKWQFFFCIRSGYCAQWIKKKRFSTKSETGFVLGVIKEKRNFYWTYFNKINFIYIYIYIKDLWFLKSAHSTLKPSRSTSVAHQDANQTAWTLHRCVFGLSQQKQTPEKLIM